MVTVLILFYVLARLLFNPVRNILTKRREEIAGEYDRIAKETEEARSVQEEYETRLKKINQEADEVLAQARKKSMARDDEMMKAAREEADRMLQRARLDIEREKAQFADDIRREIIDVATVMASKFVAVSIDEDTKAKLFKNTLDEIEEVEWLR
nr:F0F1 ATP synthase subunit B [Anaerotalea alkaliphila]